MVFSGTICQHTYTVCWLPQEPFYGGTYYPLTDRFSGGQLVAPAFSTVLRRIAKMWDSGDGRKALRERVRGAVT